MGRIEQIAAGQQIFARQRVTIRRRASLIPRDSKTGQVALANYKARTTPKVTGAFAPFVPGV